MTCKCGGIILADTEGWTSPVCYECWLSMGMPEFEPEFSSDIFVKYQDLLAKHEQVLKMLAVAEEALNWYAENAYWNDAKCAIAALDEIERMKK